MSYAAIVCRAKLRSHPTADRLQLCDCFGETVIVGLDTKDGDLGVFFPVDGQLSEEFAQANDLVRRKDAEGNNAGGFFEENRKVRAQKFRGVISTGFWVPIGYFEYLGTIALADLLTKAEGYQFDALDLHEICRKYVTPATLRAATAAKKKKTGRHQTPTFPMHDETQQFAYFVDHIRPGSLLVITTKAHGTSGRVGNVLDEVPVVGWRKKVNELLRRDVFKPKSEYKFLHGTRRVILSRVKDFSNDFHSHGFREEVAQAFEGKLKTGELVYFEVLGFEPDGKPIMPPADTTKLADKTFTKTYGATMQWSYGCAPGEHRILIYRIAYSMPDGTVIDLPWADVKRRALEMGMETVLEETCEVEVETEFDEFETRPITFIYEGNREELIDIVKDYADGQDPLGNHWKEGVVVRVDGARPKFYKYKNDIFKFLESIIKDDPTVVDTEEAA